jgi:MFS family permease
MMCLMLVVLSLPFASYIAAISIIQQEWGLNNTQSGAVYSAYLAGYAISALVVIPLTDRFGPRRIILSGLPLSIVAHAIFPLAADNMASAMALLALGGLGFAGVYMPGLRIISRRFPSRGRGMAVGLYVTASYAGHSLSLAATGGLMSSLEWRDAYLVAALVSFAALPLAYLLLRGHTDRPSGDSTGRLDLSVLRNRPARYFILGYSLHAWELYAVRVWLPAFLVAALVARGVDDEQAVVRAATVGGIALAAGALGPVVGGMVSDRWGRAASASAIFAFSGACSWAIGWTGDFPWPIIVGLAIVYGWAISADSAIYSTAITEVAEYARLGSTMAVQAFLGFSGGIVGPIVVGAILDASSESWGLAFSSVGVVAVVAVAVLLRVRSVTQGSALASGD